MTTPKEMPSLGPFLGVSNRREEFSLGTEAGDFLKGAENLDITNQGTLKRRRGTTLIVDGLNCHSLYADEHGCFYADNNNLYRVYGDDATARENLHQEDGSTLHVLPDGKQLSYAHDGVNPIFTDGLRNWRILPDDRVAPLGPPTISLEPVCTASTGGALPAGLYLIAFVQTDEFGRESAANAQQVTVPANGKIDVAGLPAAFPAWVNSIIVYLSGVNGDVLYRSVELVSPVSSISIPVSPSGGGRLMARSLNELPAGDIIRFVSGRAWVANGKFVFYSPPWATHLYERGFIPFPEDVTMMELVPNGIFIATTAKTYFIGGDPEQAELRNVFPYGAIPRTSVRMPETHECGWMSTRGWCVGSADGSAKNLQEAEVFIDPARVGASLVREQDGLRQVISGLFNTTPGRTKVGAFWEAS